MSKFKVWIEDDQVAANCQSAIVFDADSQRKSGFQAGTGASSIRVNSALRQANLVVVALVNALNIPNTYDLTSSLEDITNWLKNTQLFKLQDLFSVGVSENYIKKSLLPETPFINLGSEVKQILKLYTRYINDLNGLDKSTEPCKFPNGIAIDKMAVPQIITIESGITDTYELSKTLTVGNKYLMELAIKKPNGKSQNYSCRFRFTGNDSFEFFATLDKNNRIYAAPIAYRLNLTSNTLNIAEYVLQSDIDTNEYDELVYDASWVYNAAPAAIVRIYEIITSATEK